MTKEQAIAFLTENHAKRKVRAVLAEEGEAADVVLNIAAGQQTAWTLPEWDDKLAELDKCKLRVDEWLPLNT